MAFYHLDETIKSAIVEELKALGFIGSDKGKCILADGSRLAASSFLTRVGFPGCLSTDVTSKIVHELLAGPKQFVSELASHLLTINAPKKAEAPRLEGVSNEGISALAGKCDFVVADWKDEEVSLEKKLVAIKRDTGEIVLSPSVDLLLLASGFTPKDVIKGSPNILVAEFDPYTTKRYYQKNLHGENIWFLNTYVAPKWQTSVSDNPGNFGGLIKRVIMHLFPREYDREYVLDWLHHAIFGRNQTILICAGAKGIGKNVIFEEVLSHLVGEPYLKKATQATLSQKFNPEFEKSKVVLFDEVITQGTEEKSTLKRLANDLISVERKGQDSKTVKNFSSMVVLTNDTGKLGLDPSERRMSCPYMTSVKLKTAIPDEEIGRFKAALSAEEAWAMEEIADFGYFLLYRKPKHRPEEALMAEYFYDLCELALPVWMTTLIGLIAEGDYVDGQIITRRDILDFMGDEEPHSKVPERMSTFKDAIESFSYRGLYKVGDVDYFRDSKKYRDVPGIKLNGDFIKAVKERSNKIKEKTETIEKKIETEKRNKDKASVIKEIEEHNKKVLEERNAEDLL